MKQATARKPLLLAAWLGLSGCGPSGGPNSPGLPERGAEAIVSAADGLEGAVRIDSVAWRPVAFGPGYGEEGGELAGRFTARFTNRTDRPLQIRYDLRFYDQDDFLVDAFIPFGQPVRLEPRQSRWIEEDFFLRTDDPRDLERVVLMRLFARVMEPD